MLAELNPYTPGAGLRPPALTGRDDQLRTFDTLVLRAKRKLIDRGMIMSGLRGVGKTALLNRLHETAERHKWVAVMVEGQPTQPGSDTTRSMLGRQIEAALVQFSLAHRLKRQATTLRNLAGAFTLTLGPATMSLSPVNTGVLDLDVQNLVEEIAKLAQTRDTAFGLFIDEMQDLDPDLTTALLIAQHRCQQRGLPFYIIGAGLPNLPGVLAERRSYAERLFDYSIVDALDDHSAREALLEPAIKYGCTYTDEALTTLAHASRGYPYFLQEFGRATWNIAPTQQFTLEDAIGGINAGTAQLDAGFFPARWDRATERERRYMQAMATLNTQRVRSADVAAILKAQPSELTTVRKNLITKGLIYDPERGQLAFTVPGMSDYITRTTNH